MGTGWGWDGSRRLLLSRLEEEKIEAQTITFTITKNRTIDNVEVWNSTWQWQWYLCSAERALIFLAFLSAVNKQAMSQNQIWGQQTNKLNPHLHNSLENN